MHTHQKEKVREVRMELQGTEYITMLTTAIATSPTHVIKTIMHHELIEE